MTWLQWLGIAGLMLGSYWLGHMIGWVRGARKQHAVMIEYFGEVLPQHFKDAMAFGYRTRKAEEARDSASDEED